MCCYFFRSTNVLFLGSLVATAEQYNDHTAPVDVIDPVTWAVINLQFHHAIADTARLTGIAIFQAIDSVENSDPCLAVAQPFQPVSENLRYPNLNRYTSTLRSQV
jgi:hypothetical protein